MFNAGKCLQRKPINQVKINRVITDFTGIVGDLLHLLKRLNPVDNLLNFRIKVLNSKAHSVKSCIVQNLQVFAGSIVWVRFKTKGFVIMNLAVFENGIKQPLQVFRTKKSGCSATNMNLPNNRRTIKP